MAIQIGKYNFEGPHTSTDALQDKSGVYSILGKAANDASWHVVDIGEAGAIRSRVANHDRKPCWRGRGHAVLAAAALYCDEPSRMRVEQELRQHFRPPCGDR